MDAWIKCETRLPEATPDRRDENGHVWKELRRKVLVSDETQRVYSAYFSFEENTFVWHSLYGWKPISGSNPAVVAWMPYPGTPYTAEHPEGWTLRTHSAPQRPATRIDEKCRRWMTTSVNCLVTDIEGRLREAYYSFGNNAFYEHSSSENSYRGIDVVAWRLYPEPYADA